ncbi:MAG: formyltransferase family protein [Bacteroidota bacterium]
MRVIFFCGDGSRYGMAHLEPMLASDFEVVAVVFGTPARWATFRRALSGKKHVDLKHRSFFQLLKRIGPALMHRWRSRRERRDVLNMVARYNVPLWTEDDVNSEAFIAKAKKLAPDLVISAAYPQIFKQPLLDIGKKQAVNFHPSLLPKFRGAHPHFWTIVEGETESGVTAHVMTTALDEGPIVAQRGFDITGFTYADLYNKIVAETPALVQDVADYYLQGRGELKPQDPAGVSYYRNNRPIHSKIFWNLHSAERIKNLSRTGTAYFFFRGKKIMLLQAEARDKNRNMTNSLEVVPGAIVDVKDNGLVVQASSGFVHIQQIRYQNKTLEFKQWAKSWRIHIGEILG